MVALSEQQIMTCCACRSFASTLAAMIAHAESSEGVIAVARDIWWKQTPVAGWLEAFAEHPRIGDVAGLKAKFGAFADLSRDEQSAAAATADDGVYQELADWNARYEAKFGHIFIICASGKSAREMLDAVKGRHSAEPYAELRVAAAEQMKITELRLAKLLPAPAPSQPSGRPSPPLGAGGVQRHSTAGSASGAAAGQLEEADQAAAAAAPGSTAAAAQAAERRSGRLRAHFLPRGGDSPSAVVPSPTAAPPGLRSPITTHMLDTAVGKPAEGVRISLQRLRAGTSDDWARLASGVTNADGRIPDLLPPGDHMPAGAYRMDFETAPYMARCHAAHPSFFAPHPFYPRVHVHFQIAPGQERQHFHIPLTWNPYGYSTYRGS